MRRQERFLNAESHGYTYTPEERAFAEKLQQSEAFVPVTLDAIQQVKPLEFDVA